MMMSNGGGDGRRRKRDHQEEEEEAFMKDYPAGYRFKPTDEELIKYYLYPKIKKLPLPPNTIKDVNIYSYNPWDLTERYGSFYFFTPRERKNPKGNVPNGAENGGHWNTISSNTPIVDNDTSKEIGYKKSLFFQLGRRSKACSKMNKNRREIQTGWHMHEYSLNKDKDEKNKSPWTEDDGHKLLDEFVVCKIYFQPCKTTKDRAVKAAAAPSIATTNTPSAAVAAVVPENHHQMHHYPLNSAAAAEEMTPQLNHHYVCRTDVAAADHRYPLASMVQETAAAPAEMMPVNHNYYYSDNVNPSSSSAILPPVNHHYYGEMNQQRLQSTILPSVNHHYHGETMNQHQSQPDMLPSVNYHPRGQINEQQLQSAMLFSVNQHYTGEMQQQWQLAVLPSVNHHTYGQMNQQQLQSAILPSVNHQHCGEMMNQQQTLESAVLPSINPHYYDEINQQQLQPAVLPSVNHPIDGQMTQKQLQEESDWAMLVAAWNNDTDFFLKLRERKKKQEQPTTTKTEKQITQEAVSQSEYRDSRSKS